MFNADRVIIRLPCGQVACVASVSSRGSSRKLGQEQKKKKMNDGGGGGDIFFCFRSNFRAITRLETLATQASGQGGEGRNTSSPKNACVGG